MSQTKNFEFSDLEDVDEFSDTDQAAPIQDQSYSIQPMVGSTS